MKFLNKTMTILILIIFNFSSNADENISSSGAVRYSDDVDYSNPNEIDVLYLCDWPEAIPDSLHIYNKFKGLNLHLWSSSELPHSLNHLNNLKYLQISGNYNLKLKELIVFIEKSYKLERLSIGFLNNEFLTENLIISNPRQEIEIPYRITNVIQEIPKEIENLKKLEELTIFECNLRYIPKEMTNLVMLKTLILNNNLIDSLPEYITNLKNLEVLELSSNKFKYLPSQLFTMRELYVLKLDGNPQLDLKDLFRKLSILNQPIKLSLQNCNINQLPDEISKCKNIREINLSFNGFKTIPIEVLKIKNLEALYINNNELSKIPDNIYLAKDLESLNLDNNKIQYLPNSLKKCKKLRYVSLYDNPISDKEIERMKKEMSNTTFSYKIIRSKK